MKYVRLQDEKAARRVVNFDAVGNISKTGSVVGMRNLYNWPKGGQVRLGAYIYNVGTVGVARLDAHKLLRG